jgi:hypothetical protein
MRSEIIEPVSFGRLPFTGRPGEAGAPRSPTRRLGLNAVLKGASDRMAGMIEMPPPEPPELKPDKIRALVEYADRMAAFMEAETELVRGLGRATPENDLSELFEGWRFTAQGLRDSYDGRF